MKKKNTNKPLNIENIFFVTWTLHDRDREKKAVPHFLYFDGIVHVRELSNFTISCNNIRCDLEIKKKILQHKIHSPTRDKIKWLNAKSSNDSTWLYTLKCNVLRFFILLLDYEEQTYMSPK